MRGLTTFLRFSVVGAAGFAVDAVVFFTLVHVVALAWWAARVLAFLTAVGVTWVGNRRYTFGSTEAPAGEGVRYLAVQSGGCLVNYLTFIGCVAWAGADRWLLMPYVAGTAAGLAFNYTLSRALVFRR